MSLVLPDGRGSHRLDVMRPYIGLFGVMLGSMMATLGTRVTSFGQADLRGGLHAGYDEGAWITTAFGVGQIVSGITCAYLASMIGARRLLLGGILVFFTSSLLGPFSTQLGGYLAAQFLAGLGSGTFLPLTVIFILRHLPRKLLIYGIAIYALNSEFSQNFAASLEGYYADHWSWRWITWQYCLMLPVMFICILVGMPRDDVPSDRLKSMDWPGLVFGWLTFGLLYAGIDQGNRLGWTSSGMVVGLFVSGALAFAAFVFRESVSPQPILKFRLLARSRLLAFFALLAGFRFIILSTAYIIPNYLQVIRNYRGLDIGAVLIWIAIPQFLIVLPLAMLLKRVDPRWTLGMGSAMIMVACLMSANLTDQWATADFLPSQIVQAVGQSLALTSLVLLIVLSIKPEEAVTIGAFIQMSRLFGGEIGVGFMQTFVRVREQVHSNLLGLHVEELTVATLDRLALYRSAVGSRMADQTEAASQAIRLLANAVAKQASVLSYIDGFQAAATVAVGCFVLSAFVGNTQEASDTAEAKSL